MLIASIVAAAGTASALPNPDARFRPGANHHLGDDSFVARFGRLPTVADDEHVRMKVHLEFVRAWLAARPATRPELAARRAELLGYLDDYIANGVTPRNTHLPWRSAVFIDDAGAICAVGYLIERSVGRALPERIAGDLARVLAAYTIGYLEWPHIDGRFERVFATMAGRMRWEWGGSDPEADGTNPLLNDDEPSHRLTPRGFGR
ncbi:MAG TPA: hypothetical protein VF516_31765 [Kofleriaceae bacterium]